ncbi:MULTISPECIES: DUF2950 domain-containing protein [unclassified Ensifer]|uniref:DUF2950 domain-containing protein n=1 Tax=unclassified Ensifer TaxID=2633371 RepID=UPI000813CE38|nr:MULTISPECIES: DUF2950 domain-containing protein [unclassified Ensifer]OCP05515.1 hypothetical protein BC362_13635 [Ensifer sp. LC14]OCP06939.1 hypothetical protein BBX50_22800 [Ensifer sp. LC11]OCP07398.1 hypothetical protein BC374_23015 [Ensifer sp. LC13]OCP31699.1 hypothetical protein BC364_22265 [Ensifer sp. LC499]
MTKLFNPLLLGTALALAAMPIGASFSQTQPPEDQPPAYQMPTEIDAYAAEEDPPAFDDPAKAVEEFKAKLAANDFDGLAKLLGLNAKKLKDSEGVKDTFTLIREGAARNVVVRDLEGRKILQIGDRLWPLPFPLTKGEDGKWAFDTYVGLEEIVNRRVGENELQAIETVQAYVDAQKDYAAQDRDADGVLEYAQKLISTPGQTDGLYWPASQGDGESPVGDAISEAALEKAKAGEGYFGYRFRILTSQGDNIAGGRYDYVINDNMIGGFALIAWPVTYAETGVKTLLVNQQGIVYERDLGPSTEAIVPFIDRFDPDDKWNVVED